MKLAIALAHLHMLAKLVLIIIFSKFLSRSIHECPIPEVQHPVIHIYSTIHISKQFQTAKRPVLISLFILRHHFGIHVLYKIDRLT